VKTPVLALLLSLSGCATTEINFRGERLLARLRGRLELAAVRTNVKIDIDPTPALIVAAGDQTALELRDDDDAPNSTLYLVVDPADLKAPHTLKDGDFIPYLQVHAPIDDQHGEAHPFIAVCKGGRGRVRIDTATASQITGYLAIAVSCRTYVDGYEREESTLELSGPFAADR
jgi:hypothetical protein